MKEGLKNVYTDVGLLLIIIIASVIMFAGIPSNNKTSPEPVLTQSMSSTIKPKITSTNTDNITTTTTTATTMTTTSTTTTPIDSDDDYQKLIYYLFR